MLVLTRKRDSAIHIGPDVTVTVLEIRKSHVKIGVEAPTSVHVWRNELSKYDESPAQSASKQPEAGKRGFEVLLVEDDPGHAKLICDALSQCSTIDSIHVAVAPTGETATESLQLDLADRQEPAPFDLVMMDLYLPRMSGLSLVRRIRTDPLLRLTPIVVFSCADDDVTASNCLAAGANAFITKSGDPQSFRTSVSRIASFWGSECHLPRQTTQQSV